MLEGLNPVPVHLALSSFKMESGGSEVGAIAPAPAPAPSSTSTGFVGVHIGAGQHSEARTPVYLAICARACAAAVDILRQGGRAVDAAAAATIVLEDAGETNAGYGSNLVRDNTE